MDFKLVMSLLAAFGFGLGFIVYGVVLKLRYRRLIKYGTYAIAGVENVTVHNRGGPEVDLAWIDDNGVRREETINLTAGLFGTEVGKTLEIYYDSSHAVAADRRPYIVYMVTGTVFIALGIVLIALLPYFD